MGLFLVEVRDGSEEGLEMGLGRGEVVGQTGAVDEGHGGDLVVVSCVTEEGSPGIEITNMV